MTLEELKQKYGCSKGMDFEPNPNCTCCHGTGERPTRNPDFPMHLCVCVFVNPNWSEFALKLINSAKS
jgi:hypothetical protein